MSVNTSELSVGVDTFPTTHFQDAFSKEVWESTYKDHNDTTIDDTMRRIAKAVASVEDTEFQQELWEERFYDMLTDFKVTAGGRIYANAGTEWGGTTMLNCFVAPRANYDIDSLPAIIDDVFKQAQTLKSEGGWGQNFSWIRPRGAFIGGIGVESPGSVKYMEIYDKVSDVITSGSGTKSKNKKAKGKIRKGAMMGILDVWHPDIIEFITAKQQPGRLTKFNISVNCTDAFMSKVINVIEWKKDLDNLKTLYSNNVTEDQQKEIVILESDIETEDVWSLRFPDTTHVGYKDNWDGDIATWESMGYPVTEFRKVSASWLWNLMMESTYNRAEPGIVFLDRANYFDPLSYYHKIIATNPCGEQVLPPAGVCNLGSVNLTQFVLADGSGFDLEQIEKYVVYTVRFLDNVNSLSNAPLPEYVDSMQNKRRIGVGILGWGSALFMLKVRFGSEQASVLRDEVMQTIAQTAYKASIDLAEEKEMFKYCDPIKHAEAPFIKQLHLPEYYMEKLRTTGIRNSACLSIQPTGNTSIFANVVSGGLEPIFMPEYIRTVIVNAMPDHIQDVTPKWYEGEWRETDMFKCVKEGDEEILKGTDSSGVVYKIDNNRGLTKEVLCQDYGVRWLADRGEWDPSADWAVTTTNLSVQDHVNDLTGFARWIDSAMSKCVAEGTLITTDKGIIPIEQLGQHDVEGFVAPTGDYKVIDEHGNLKSITSHYYGAKKPCALVRFNNGFELTMTYVHKFKTENGWKNISELCVGDKVFYRTNLLNISNEYQKIDRPHFAPNAKHISFPEVVDEDFAMLLGMWIADGSLTENSISICEKNQNVADLCEKLMLSLFGTHKSAVDGRWNVQTHFVHSRTVSRWFRENVGHGAENKQTPSFILKSPPSVQKAFIEGLTLDGYIKRDNYTSKLVVFDGYAKDVAEKLTYMLSALGIEYSLLKRSVGDNKLTYGVTAYLPDNDIIVPIEEHKQHFAVTGKTQKQTYISDEDFEKLISMQPRNTYGAMIRARLRKCKKRSNYVRMSFLDKCNFVYDDKLTCVAITDIDDVGYKKVYDIEVEDTHSYLINGIVSHNTINVPNEYPLDKFKNIYLDTYRSGSVKGVTTYRAGTMASVLSAAEEKDATSDDEEIIKDDVKLPDSAPAVLKTIRAEGRKWYLTVVYHENSPQRPFALFVKTNSHEKGVTADEAVDLLVKLAKKKKIPKRHRDAVLEKMKTDTNSSKVARLISFLLRHGVLIKNVVSALDRVENTYVGTFVFQIKKFLSTYIKDGEKVEDEKCMECGATTIVYSEGCKKCLSCGSSKCG